MALQWAAENPDRTVECVLAALPAWTGTAADAPAAASARFTAARLRADGLEQVTAEMIASSPPWLGRELAKSWRSQWPHLPAALDEASEYHAPGVGDLERITVPVGIAAATDDVVHPSRSPASGPNDYRTRASSRCRWTRSAPTRRFSATPASMRSRLGPAQDLSVESPGPGSATELLHRRTRFAATLLRLSRCLRGGRLLLALRTRRSRLLRRGLLRSGTLLLRQLLLVSGGQLLGECLGQDHRQRRPHRVRFVSPLHDGVAQDRPGGRDELQSAMLHPLGPATTQRTIHR